MLHYPLRTQMHALVLVLRVVPYKQCGLYVFKHKIHESIRLYVKIGSIKVHCM